MNWFLLTIISVVAVSIANILQRVLMKGDKSNPYSYAIVFHFVLGVFNLAFALFVGAHFSLFDGNPALLLLASVLWGASTVCMFKALQLLESSEVIILATIRVVITIGASIIFLHESFNIQKVIGTIIIIGATFLVTNLKQGFQINKGIIYVFGMALFSGLAIVIDAFYAKQFDPVAYNTISNFLIVLLLLGIYPKAVKQWKHFIQPSFLKKMLPLAIFSTIQAITYLYAFAIGGDASQIGPIRQSQVIVTVLLAVILLNERSHLLKKFVAALLTLLGVVLLG